MKSLRSRGRANSPAAETPNRSSRSSSVTRIKHSTKDASSPKKNRPITSTVPTSVATTSASEKSKRKSKFYNKTCAERPTELFRTDLISNMTVADSEPMNSQLDLILFTDQWRRDWNDGVQVPVYEGDLPCGSEKDNNIDNLKFPKDRSPSSPSRPPAPIYHEIDDDEAGETANILSPTLRPSRKKRRHEDVSGIKSSSKIGRHDVQYELDDLDIRWLRLVNASLFDSRFPRFLLTEDQLEKAMERLEVVYALRCADEQQSPAFLRQKADNDAVCDVCRGESSEDGNLLVFCDRCNVCVHQACYGIRRVPVGSWLCRPCSLDLRPSCVLCPNRGGAMKPTKSGNVWAHVSCAIWVPEIEFGNTSLKEPITGIARIPEDRWMLQCDICQQRGGACVQCNVRNCHISYHVTCAQRAGWKVTYKEAALEDGSTDVLENYCKKHSKNWPPNSSDDDGDSNLEMATNLLDYKRSTATASVAYRVLTNLCYSDLEHVFEQAQEIPIPFRQAIFYYWKARRLSAPERILIFDIGQCQLALERDRETEFICRRVDYLILLRQTLEKTRTLCYMVERREKLKRQWINNAAEEFRLMSSIEHSTSNSTNTNSKSANQQQQQFKMGQFLESFSFGYQPEIWLPKMKKLAELTSLVPTSMSSPMKTAKCPSVIQSATPRKRGRPPKISQIDGSHSPLAIVNNGVTARSKNTGKPIGKKRESSVSVSSDLQDGKEKSGESNGNGDGSIRAHPSKRRRTPRIQYSPT